MHVRRLETKFRMGTVSGPGRQRDESAGERASHGDRDLLRRRTVDVGRRTAHRSKILTVRTFLLHDRRGGAALPTPLHAIAARRRGQQRRYDRDKQQPLHGSTLQFHQTARGEKVASRAKVSGAS